MTLVQDDHAAVCNIDQSAVQPHLVEPQKVVDKGRRDRKRVRHDEYNEGGENADHKRVRDGNLGAGEEGDGSDCVRSDFRARAAGPAPSADVPAVRSREPSLKRPLSPDPSDSATCKHRRCDRDEDFGDNRHHHDGDDIYDGQDDDDM